MQTPTTLPAPTCATHAYRAAPAGSCGACQRQQALRQAAHVQAAAAARLAWQRTAQRQQALGSAIAHGLAQQTAQRTGARNA